MKQPWKVALLIGALTFLFFSPALKNDFVLFDDDLHVFRNPKLLYEPSPAKTFWLQSYKGFYIPMTYSAWAGILHFAKTRDTSKRWPKVKPFPFHFANVLLHAVNAGLLFFLLKLFSAHLFWPLVGTALFAVHPIQVESVAWVTGLKDLLACFFCLLCALAHYRWRSSVAALVLFLLAMLSKPAVVFLPLLFIGLDIFTFRRRWTPTLVRFVPWLALAVPFVLLTRNLQMHQPNLFVTPILKRPLIFADAIGFYLSKLLIPLELAIDYGRTPLRVLQSQSGLICGIMLVLAIGIFIYLNWRKGLLLLGAFVIALLPVSGLLPFSFQTFSTVADHYLYLPLFALSLVIVLEFRHVVVPKKVAIAVAALFVVFAARSLDQMRHWRSADTLLAHSLKINPQSMIAINNMAVFHEEENQTEKALTNYQELVRLAPEFAHHQYNLGNALLKMSRIEEAVPHLLKALELDPNLADAHFNLGIVAEAARDYPRARLHFEQSIRLDPVAARGYFKLGSIAQAQGRHQEAKENYLVGLSLDPRSERGQQLLADLFRKYPKLAKN